MSDEQPVLLRIAALLEIVETVAKTDSTWHNDVNGEMLCPFCTGFQTQDQWLIEKGVFPHDADCIVTKARTLIKDEL